MKINGQEINLSNSDLAFVVRGLERLRCARIDGPRVFELIKIFQNLIRVKAGS